MAKNIVFTKEYNKRNQYMKFFLKRRVHFSFLKDNKLSIPERQIISQKLSKIKYKSSVVRLKNYCMITGHSRSVYRDVKLSRHKLNQMGLNGSIPGCILVLGKMNSLASLVALIKISISRGRLTARVPYSNLNLNLLKILYYEGYIKGFKVTASPKKIYVFLKVVNFRPSILDIAFFCPKNKHSYLSYKKLVSLYGLKTFGIISTNIDY